MISSRPSGGCVDLPKQEVVFLLGAGVSKKAGVPLVDQFVDEFKRDVVRSWDDREDLRARTFEEISRAWQETTPAGVSLHLERLYELLTWINGEATDPPIPISLPSGFPRQSRATSLLLWELRKYILDRCQRVKAAQVRYLRPITRFLRHSCPLPILTLNYDPCVEIACEASGVPWSDGFAETELPWNEPQPIDPAVDGRSVQLLKLHGSATWYQTSPGRVKRAILSSGLAGLRLLGEARSATSEAAMIYPTLNKALTEGPFPRLMVVAQEVLSRARLCLAMGYAFADLHIRHLLLEALLHNQSLELVVVNPVGEEVVDELYRDEFFGPLHDTQDRSIKRRIGFIGGNRGRAEVALADEWLLHQTDSWLTDGINSLSPFAQWETGAAQSLSGDVVHEHSEGIAEITRGSDNEIYFTSRSPRKIYRLDQNRQQAELVSGAMNSPRGLAWDSFLKSLLVVENRHHTPWWLGRKKLPAGMGQVWTIPFANGESVPLTTMFRGRTLWRLVLRWLRHPEWPLKTLRSMMQSRELPDYIGWPTRIAVEHPGRSVLLTDARRLLRLDLETGRLTVPLEIPLCFNLVGLALEANGVSVLLGDAGIHPAGRGRLMRGFLKGPRAGDLEILSEGWQQLAGLASLPQRGWIAFSEGTRWPEGRVVVVETHEPGSPIRSFGGLDRPSSIFVGDDESHLLVPSGVKLVRLSL